MALLSRIGENGRVAVATCNGFWISSEIDWVKNIPWPFSRWELPNRALYVMIERNIYNSIKTVVIVPELRKNVSVCLDATFSNRNAFYLADWVLLTDDPNETASMDRATRLICGNTLPCKKQRTSSNFKQDPINALDSRRSVLILTFYSMDYMQNIKTKKVEKIGGTAQK